MALFLNPSLLFPNPNPTISIRNQNNSNISNHTSLHYHNHNLRKFPPFPFLSLSQQNPDSSSFPRKKPIEKPSPNTTNEKDFKAQKPIDEWGEETEFEDVTSATKLSDSDPPKHEDEWEEDVGIDSGNSDVSLQGGGDVDNNYGGGDGDNDGGELGNLKQCLVDSFYGTEFGFRATSETRAEIVELVSKLEAANPTPAPTQEASLLNGNWVLLYTAFSELLPLLAVGSLPLLKVKSISQEIDTGAASIQNFVTFSSPFATFSFSASASFESRSPLRIQVQFKEGTFQPPQILSTVDLPANIDIFGQKIDLLPLQQSLGPLQEFVANISRVISGQPPLKVPIPGERTQSWLVTTYLDKDLRISRGDGGLFVLVKAGSPLLTDI